MSIRRAGSADLPALHALFYYPQYLSRLAAFRSPGFIPLGSASIYPA